MTLEFPTENFSSPTNVSKSVTNASWPWPLELYPCSVRKVLRWIPALWSCRHSSRPLSGFCPALPRLLSFHPDCSDCSAGQSVGVVLSPFPCLSSVLIRWHLWGRGCWCSQRSPPSVGRIAKSEWVLCLCWECHRSFSTACLLLHWPLSWTLLSFLPWAL